MPNDTKNETPNPIFKILTRIAFIIGVVLVIALLAFAATRILPRVFSYIGSTTSSIFSSIFKKNEELVVTTSKNTVSSGEPFTISWSLSTSTISSSFNYTCVNDLTLVYVGSQNTRIPVICGRQFKIGGSIKEATLIANLKKENSFADLDIAINTETPDGDTFTGFALVTVTSNKSTSTPIQNTKATTTVVTKPSLTVSTSKPAPYTNPIYTPVYSGPADLTVSNINSLSTYPYPTISFTVTNTGGNFTGPWTLRAATSKSTIFNSGSLVSLAPLQSATFTLNLGSSIPSGSNAIIINLDPTNQVLESNESNNSSSININGVGENTTISGTRADLVPKILDVDYSNNSRTSIKFEVRNIGGNTARDWRFEAELPTDDKEVYRSSEQNDLPPGGVIVYTLQIDDVEDDEYFEITVDSEEDLREEKENNNTDRVRINN